MENHMLTAERFVNKARGCTIRLVKSDTEYFVTHTHNYFEIFLITNGNAKHIVNDKEQSLITGSLLFIRDIDNHCYSLENGKYFEFLNVSFEKETLFSMFNYLGEGLDSNALLKSKIPPTVLLTQYEKNKLFYSFMEINSIKDNDEAKTKLKALLLNVFAEYFFNLSNEKSEIPLWLENAYEKMKKPENFIEGINKMVKISGKTREHLSRTMKKYYNITPTEYITELRLNYAINLMNSSNLNITEICFECGFSNLSWFYNVFKEKYKITPYAYKHK